MGHNKKKGRPKFAKKPESIKRRMTDVEIQALSLITRKLNQLVVEGRLRTAAKYAVPFTNKLFAELLRERERLNRERRKHGKDPLGDTETAQRIAEKAQAIIESGPEVLCDVDWEGEGQDSR